MIFKITSSSDTIELSLRSLWQRFVTKRFSINRPELFFSNNYGFYFSSISQYWLEIGKKNALLEILIKQKQLGIRGYSFEEFLQK